MVLYKTKSAAKKHRRAGETIVKVVKRVKGKRRVLWVCKRRGS